MAHVGTITGSMTLDPSAYISGLNQAAQQTMQFQQSVASSGAGMASMGAGAGRAATQLGGLNRSIYASMTAFYMLSTRISAALGVYEEYSNVLSRIGATADMSTSSIMGLSEALRGLNRDMGGSRTDMMKGMYRAVQSGFTTPDQFMPIAESAMKLRTASGREINTVKSADAISVIRNSLGIKGGKEGMITDMLLKGRDVGRFELNEMTSALGIPLTIYGNQFSSKIGSQETLRQVITLLATSTQAGLSPNRAATGVRRMVEKTLMLGNKPGGIGKNLHAGFAGLGYSSPIDALNEGPMKYLENLLKITGGGTSEGLTKMGFGAREFMVLASTLRGNMGSAREIHGKLSAGNISGTTDKYIDKQKEEWWYTRDRIRSAYEDSQINFMEAILPTMKGFAASIEVVNDLFQALSPAVKNIIALMTIGAGFNLMKNFFVRPGGGGGGGSGGGADHFALQSMKGLMPVVPNHLKYSPSTGGQSLSNLLGVSTTRGQGDPAQWNPPSGKMYPQSPPRPQTPWPSGVPKPRWYDYGRSSKLPTPQTPWPSGVQKPRWYDYGRSSKLNSYNHPGWFGNRTSEGRGAQKYNYASGPTQPSYDGSPTQPKYVPESTQSGWMPDPNQRSTLPRGVQNPRWYHYGKGERWGAFSHWTPDSASEHQPYRYGSSSKWTPYSGPTQPKYIPESTQSGWMPDPNQRSTLPQGVRNPRWYDYGRSSKLPTPWPSGVPKPRWFDYGSSSKLPITQTPWPSDVRKPRWFDYGRSSKWDEFNAPQSPVKPTINPSYAPSPYLTLRSNNAGYGEKNVGFDRVLRPGQMLSNKPQTGFFPPKHRSIQQGTSFSTRIGSGLIGGANTAQFMFGGADYRNQYIQSSYDAKMVGAHNKYNDGSNIAMSKVSDMYKQHGANFSDKAAANYLGKELNGLQKEFDKTARAATRSAMGMSKISGVLGTLGSIANMAAIGGIFALMSKFMEGWGNKGTPEKSKGITDYSEAGGDSDLTNGLWDAAGTGLNMSSRAISTYTPSSFKEAGKALVNPLNLLTFGGLYLYQKYRQNEESGVNHKLFKNIDKENKERYRRYGWVEDGEGGFRKSTLRDAWEMTLSENFTKEERQRLEKAGFGEYTSENQKTMDDWLLTKAGGERSGFGKDTSLNRYGVLGDKSGLDVNIDARTEFLKQSDIVKDALSNLVETIDETTKAFQDFGEYGSVNSNMMGTLRKGALPEISMVKKFWDDQKKSGAYTTDADYQKNLIKQFINDGYMPDAYFRKQGKSQLGKRAPGTDKLFESLNILGGDAGGDYAPYMKKGEDINVFLERMKKENLLDMYDHAGGTTLDGGGKSKKIPFEKLQAAMRFATALPTLGSASNAEVDALIAQITGVDPSNPNYFTDSSRSLLKRQDMKSYIENVKTGEFFEEPVQKYSEALAFGSDAGYNSVIPYWAEQGDEKEQLFTKLDAILTFIDKFTKDMEEVVANTGTTAEITAAANGAEPVGAPAP